MHVKPHVHEHVFLNESFYLAHVDENNWQFFYLSSIPVQTPGTYVFAKETFQIAKVSREWTLQQGNHDKKYSLVPVRPTVAAHDLAMRVQSKIFKEILVYRPHEHINIAKEKLANEMCCSCNSVNDTWEVKLARVEGALCVCIDLNLL